MVGQTFSKFARRGAPADVGYRGKNSPHGPTRQSTTAGGEVRRAACSRVGRNAWRSVCEVGGGSGPVRRSGERSPRNHRVMHAAGDVAVLEVASPDRGLD